MAKNQANKKEWEYVVRLIQYTVPYRKNIAISLVFLVFIIALELVRPIVLGKAIDNVLISYEHPYAMMENKEAHTIQIADFYVADGSFADHKVAKIVYAPDLKIRYYIVPNIDIKQFGDYNQLIITETTDGFYADNSLIHAQAWPIKPEQMAVLRKADTTQLIQYVLLFIGISIMTFILSYIQEIILNYTGQKVIYTIRNQVYQHIQKMHLQFFNLKPVGVLVTRVTNDTETLNEMYTTVIVNTIKSIVMLVGIIIMMAFLNIKLTLAIICLTPLIYLTIIWFRNRSRKIYQEIRTKIAILNAFLAEHISGIKIVQLFYQEERKKEEFARINQDLIRSNIKQLITFSVFRPLMYMFYIIGLIIVLLYGGYQVIEGYMTIGVLVVFIEYISRFFDPIQQLAEQFDIIQSAIAASEKIFNLLDEENPIQEVENPITSKQFKGEIEFKNVWFAYNEEWVLRDVSFVAHAGETIAFVGATGAGKSSILNLINRYYDIQKGQILIDGIDIKAYALDTLRKNIGQMQQDVFIFTGDIKSNIRLKNEKLTDDMVIKYAKYVNADQFIQRLPNQYNEVVYEQGGTFSAGQRQLISFARTLAAEPSILVLDEATSNIDTETELLIQDALEKIMKDRTTLVVAHRLSTIQYATRIIVLHKGKIKEVGNHQELLAHKGIYYDLYRLQYEKKQQNEIASFATL